VAQVAIVFLTNRSLKADRLLGDLEYLPDFVERKLHLLCYFFRSGFATEFLNEVTRSPNELVDSLDHVHRDANRSSLISDCPCNSLPNPPSRVGAELIAAAVLELVHSLHEANVALLDEVQELQPAVGVFLGYGHN